MKAFVVYGHNTEQERSCPRPTEAHGGHLAQEQKSRDGEIVPDITHKWNVLVGEMVEWRRTLSIGRERVLVTASKGEPTETS